MAYFKLEFGFGRNKSEGKISDSANHADEQAVLEIPGWDFVKAEVERAKQQGRFKVAGNYLTAARSFTKFIGTDNWLFSDMTAEKLESYQFDFLCLLYVHLSFIFCSFVRLLYIHQSE